MPAPAAAQDETARQRALDAYHVLDSLPEATYDDIARVASAVCGTPTALISLVDRDRQWFKAKIGFEALQTPRSMAVCDHAIRTPDRLLEVPDLSRDARFVANPLVDGRLGAARFYAGAPLVTPEGAAIGTVCVLDDEPRTLDDDQREALRSLARLTMTLLDGRARERALGAEAFVATVTQPPAAQAERSYTLAVIELQDFAGTTARLGERATEKLLLQLNAELEACLPQEQGDAVTRSGGNLEYVAVLHGDGADAVLQRLRETIERYRQAYGMQFLYGVARTDGSEPPHAVFARADADLLAQKAAASGHA